jgi:phosphate transport system permease protein
MDRRRRIVDRLARGACLGATLLALVPLVSVLVYVAARGIGALSLSFFTSTPQPVGVPGGGLANAITGSLVLVGLATLASVPIGVAGGLYLAEIGRGRLATAARFAADVLTGIPSITIGVFVYGLVVLSMRRFSALAGAVALAVLMLPTIVRTTEEMVRLVPSSLREAGLALGVPAWRVTLLVVLRSAAPGVATGIMLAVARAAGETAPLLFTAFGNRHVSLALDQPIGSMPVQIYTYAVSPYADWHRQAWGAALVLLAAVLILNVSARALAAHRGGAR